MKIGILKETRNGEKRVAAIPETIKKYISWENKVIVEKNAGHAAGFIDNDYIRAGGLIVDSREQIFTEADILLSIWAPEPEEYKFLRPDQILIADFESGRYLERATQLSKTGITALALEKMPRISRAQSMDILSSQNNLAGYKAALLAINALNRGISLMITSAGTIPPAKALVMGAGVAGLQAIATLKRMGAVVYASDVRAAAKEQVESLGGRFLVVTEGADFEEKGGYSGTISPEFLLKQKELITEQLKQTDILITTALSGGKSVPLLVTNSMLSVMPQNAVVVDMAGGNVEKNENMRPDIILIQNNNLASLMPDSASRLFAKNIYNLLEAFGGKNFKINLEDEIMSAICLTYNGLNMEK